MGQRLNIEIVIDGKTKANAYYHWSGYTKSAVDLVYKILKADVSEKFDNDLMLKAVKLLEETGAGLIEKEFKYLNNVNIPVKKALDRNYGLIAVSKKEIENTRYWEETRATINFDNNTVDMHLCFLDYEPEYYDENYDPVVKQTDFDIFKIPFHKFKDFISLLYSTDVLEINDNYRLALIE
jgi:hypothetical protein